MSAIEAFAGRLQQVATDELLPGQLRSVAEHITAQRGLLAQATVESDSLLVAEAGNDLAYAAERIEEARQAVAAARAKVATYIATVVGVSQYRVPTLIEQPGEERPY